MFAFYSLFVVQIVTTLKESIHDSFSIEFAMIDVLTSENSSFRGCTYPQGSSLFCV